MAIRRILYIAGRTVSMFTIKNRELIDVQVYGHDVGGLAAFTDDLQVTPAYPTWVLADISEEEFHSANVPHVYGRDRRMMLQRKINNLFRGTRFRKPFRLGREKEGRRDDLFLLTGISNQDMLDPWIERLLNEHIPIPGVHSIPLLTRHLYKLLKPAFHHVLIISHGEMSGMRQTYFDDNQLRVSRLTPTRRLTAPDYLQLASVETYKFWHFLTSTRALPDNEILHVIVLGNSDVEAAAKNFQSDNPLVKFHAQDLDRLIDKTGFKGIRDTEYADDFFAVLLASSRQSNPYAAHKDRRFFYHLLASRGLIAASILTLVYTLSLLPNRILDGLDTFEAHKTAVSQQQRFLQLYEQTQLSMPEVVAPGAIMAQAVETHKVLLKHRGLPLPLLKAVGSVLAKSPGLTLNKITWLASSNAGNDIILAALRTATTQDDEEENTDNEYPDDQGTESVTLDDAPVLILSGDIAIGPGGVRKAIDHLNTLQLRLNTLAIVSTTRIINYPLEINPEKTLTGGSNKSNVNANNGQFSIRITASLIP